MRYITTPIFYINSTPHVGTAESVLAADVLARHARLSGEETFFLTGTDEHGEKANQAAANAGQTHQAYADAVAARFKTIWHELDFTYDGFIQTTNPAHIKVVQKFLTRLHDHGHIYSGTYTGWYCVGCEEFKTETDAGPNHICPLHLTPLTQINEPTYFFRLSAFRDQLIELIDTNAFRVAPIGRKNEVLSFLRSDELRDVAISRQNDPSGIVLPWDDKYTVYVWIDALLNYYTATDPAGPSFGICKPAFPPSDQIIGKDILRFHAVIWPALLIAADQPLPKSLFVHSYLTVDGQKISKSLGNAISPIDLTKTWGVDAVRWYLLKIFPYAADGNFDTSQLPLTYASDLANNLGNLVNRVVTMLTKYANGVVPASAPTNDWLDPNDPTIDRLLHTYEFPAAIAWLTNQFDRVNSYIETNRPWALAKSDDPTLATVLATFAHNLFVIGTWLAPFLPTTSEAILSVFGSSCHNAKYATLSQKSRELANITVKPVAPLFPRKDESLPS